MNDYQRIERIICYLDEHRSEQPDLETVSKVAGLSQFHLHRLFSDWAGITPKAFLKCLNIAHAKQLLNAGESVLDAALDSGLSGPSRLHDLCVSLEAATPGEIKSGGSGWTIIAGFADTPFGICLVGENSRGICHLSFVPSRKQDDARESIHSDWPNADVSWDNSIAERVATSTFVRDEGQQRRSFKTIVKGTEFQVRVWRALLKIPEGALVSYSQIAESVCTRNATRAVASAIARNQIAMLIPCHRVIRQTGAISDYRWGAHRKRAMIAWETCLQSARMRHS